MGDFINELVGMGFPQNRAEKAIFFTKRRGVQQALDWYVKCINGRKINDMSSFISDSSANVAILCSGG